MIADEVKPGEGVDVSPQAAVDFGLAAQRGDTAVGLSHGNAHRSIRRARGACERGGLPRLAAFVRVGR